MLTEAQKAELVHHLETSVEWRYPIDGADALDFNPKPFTYRSGEPVSKKYPAIQISFLPRSEKIVAGLGDVIGQSSGQLIYGYGELEPITIGVYTHQVTTGTSGKPYHGKILADAYIRRIERYIRRYWPKKLQNMEAYIYKPMGFYVQDISEFLQGSEQQGFELTFHIVSTNKWDYAEDPYTGVANASYTPTEYVFEDAVLSGQQYDVSKPYQVWLSVSGTMQDRE